MPDAAVTFSDLTLSYGGHPAVHHLHGVVCGGSLTPVAGAKGSVKSTLMKAIAGMLAPMTGKCALTPCTRLGYLPQSEVDRSFPARVLDTVSLGLWPRRGLLGRRGPDDRDAVAGAMMAVGPQGFERRAIDSLSGGQMQRALFARVLVQHADNCADCEANAAAHSERLSGLDAEVWAAIPEDNRVIVVAHDAYRYFARDYGLHFLSPVGISTETDAFAADVAGLIREIRNQDASVVFAENIADSLQVQQIASEAGLTLCGLLCSDALPEPDGPAPTYVEIMRANVSTITRAIAAR